MLQLSRKGDGSAAGPVADDLAPLSSERSADDIDGIWSELVIDSRGSHNAVYDPVRDRMVVFGGNSPTASADTRALSLEGSTTWSELSPADVPPDARSAHAAVYDAASDRMVVFGGNPFRDDVWALAWSPPADVDDPPA